MRKLYTLVAGAMLALASLKTNAQLILANEDFTASSQITQFITINSGDEVPVDINSITETCQANFEVSPSATSPLTKRFTAIPWHSEQKRPVYICWKFGDGTDTCIQYSNTFQDPYVVTHHYSQPGLYEVCVKIVYQNGCEARLCKSITIGENCRADFEKLGISPTANPLFVTYKALPWHSNNRKPKTIHWQFGDGKDTTINYTPNDTSGYFVRHKYNQPGLYEVCIRIIYFEGCESVNCKRIQVGRADECRADFERVLLSSTNNLLTTTFKALPWNSNNRNPKSIHWKFGDGRDTVINYTENYTGNYLVHHTYNQPGAYEVCIKIVYFGGCEATKCHEFNIGIFCRTDFEKVLVNTSANPLGVYYKALPWHSQDKKPKTICWRFGDGKDTCITYPESYTGLYGVRHEYAQRGQYEVCVKITYYGGCESYKCKLIQIGDPVSCKADFERIPLSSTNNPFHVAFKALPWHFENKKPKTICWKFGDGSDTCIQYPENYTGNYIINHRYNQPGNYEVCVRILYYGGCEARKCELINITGPGECTVKLFELTPSINSLVRGFFASPQSTENKRPLRVCWYFGDGTDTCIQLTTNILLPQLFIRHTYPAPGVYRACVKVLFDGGCIATACDEVVIRSTTNVCGGYMTDSLLSPRTFRFRGFAIHIPDDPVIGYRWTFGDGSSATGQEVTHQYNSPGNYEVCLTIRTQRGCETRICKILHVPGNTQSVLQVTPNPVQNIMHVLFYSSHNEPVIVRIVNNYGVVVRSWTRNATQGANNWDFDVSALTAGAYTIYVQSPNQLSSQLFIKN